MQRVLVVAVVASALSLAAGVGATTYSGVTVDGDLGDFAADEHTAGDPLGDGSYGANNDLGQLYVTWDATQLYLGFDYRAWGTAVLYLVEAGNSGGATTLCPVSGYGGAFPANVQGPGFDLMLGLFVPDDSTTPVPFLFALSAGGSTDITSSSAVAVMLKETVNTATPQHEGSVELKLPWDTLYGLGAGKVPPGAKLQIAGVMRGKLDGDGLGDVSPDPAGAVNQSACGSATGNSLSKFHEVTIDADGDGVPEQGWSPGSNSAQPDAGPDSQPPDLSPPLDMPPVDAAALDLAGADAANSADRSTSDSAAADGPPAGDGKGAKDEGCACSAKGSSATAAAFSLFLLGLALVDRRRAGR